MQNIHDLDANIVYTQHSGDSDLVQGPTADKIEELSAQGYTIKVGNNPQMDKAAKWGDSDLVRVSQVNSIPHRRGGEPLKS